MDNAIQRPCPNCQAKPGQWCTRPTATGREKVTWFHVSRQAAYSTQGKS